MTKWLARKLSSSDHRTLLSKPLIFFFPSSSSLLVYSYLTIYNVNIYNSVNKIELNWNAQQMPGGMCTLGIDWAIMPSFLSTAELSIDGGWLNKRKLLSNSLGRNFSFLSTSTPSTAATTSAEKSHAFAKSSCSHRQMFFPGVSTKVLRRWRSQIVVKKRRASSSSDNSDTFSGSFFRQQISE